MPTAVSSEQISDDELVELELEQRQLDLDRELKQRQLDLDRKKIKLQKRRAKLHTTVDLTSDDHPTEVKAEPADDVSPNSPADSTANPLPSLPPSEATKISVGKNPAKEQQEIVVLAQSHRAGQPKETDRGARERILEEASVAKSLSNVDPTTTPIASACHPTTKSPELGQSQSLAVTAASVGAASPSRIRRPQVPSPEQAPSPIREHHYCLLGGGTLKRSHSPESEPDIRDEVKRQRMLTGTNRQIADTKTKDGTEIRKIGKRARSAIIRRYGERLIHHHMQSFRKNTPAEREQLRNAADKVVNGLLEKKFENLDELHNEYEDQIRQNCDYVLRAELTIELEKFYRAAPVWWKECLEMNDRIKREELVMTVLQDVKEGKYDIGYPLQSKAPASNDLPSHFPLR